MIQNSASKKDFKEITVMNLNDERYHNQTKTSRLFYFKLILESCFNQSPRNT